jgi:putative endopeptidase
MVFRSLIRHARGVTSIVRGALAVGILLSGASAVAQSPGSHAPGHADTTCAACGDFYSWANRAWLDTASIPASSAEVGTWSANDARVTAQLHAVLRAAAATPPARATFTDRTLATLYASCMDSARANADGIAPIRSDLAAIDAIRTPADFARELARLHRDGVLAVFTFASEVDRSTDLHYAPILDVQRLPLGTHGYAPRDSAGRRRLEAYRAHVARTLALAGESTVDAARDADAVVAIEGALAAATPAQPEDMSVADMFRHASLAQIERDGPGFDWRTYLHERGAPELGSIIVQAPAYFTGVSRLASERPMAEWRADLRWRLLASASPFLSDDFVREDFAYARQGSGTAELAPRWERCTREISADVPEVLGRAYAARTFPPGSKARIDSMVTQIRAVLLERIATVPWLTDATRRATLEKARHFGVKIGYPDRWHDVSGLDIPRGAFVTERAAARRFESDRMVRRIGRAPDRREWDYHDIYHFIPQSPTAWANWDEIIFPAGYLQPPLYDANASAADNFGAMGVIIGHEMTHLFTADGGDIDARGAVHHWWTPTDSVRFAAIQQRLIRQFDAYTVLDSATHVNGTNTVSENLADLGGIELAFAAMERTLASQPRRHYAPGDTTPEQRFFLSYARARASKARPERLRQIVRSDWHAPSKYRVDGPLSDFAGFARAFGCRDGDPMVRPDSVRVRIWDRP